MFEQIIDASKGKQIVMFLDYDGTLSPIVDDPDKAFMSKQVVLSPLYSTSLFYIYIYIYIVTEVSVVVNSDESNSEKACKIFPYCNSEWEVQRQGTFGSFFLFFNVILG
jgi:hypothetical protein